MRFDFTREEYKAIKERLMLNEELSKILQFKIEGKSIIEMSNILHCSESTINRRIKTIKRKLMKII